MFVWGNYPLKSNIEGFYGHWVIDLMKRGMKLVTVDPKVTWLASKSELHLRVRPGTDAALALGMMKVIIEEDLYDHEFVDNWCYGFDELAERAKEFRREAREPRSRGCPRRRSSPPPACWATRRTPRCSGAWPLT